MIDSNKLLPENNINRPLVARLKSLMVRKGLNPKTLAERANVGRSFVYDILNGKSSNPTGNKLTAIAEQLDVSVQYLLSGVHQVLNPKQTEWSSVVEIPSIDIESSAGGSIAVMNESDRKPYYFRSDWIHKKLRSRPEDLRAVFVKDDGMHPTFMQGDMMLINITLKSPNPPGIFILFDGAGLVVKRLEMIDKDRIRVLSDNDKYTSYEREISTTNITGKVVWLAREL